MSERGERKPLANVVGLKNKLRVILNKEPQYNKDTLDMIGRRGITPKGLHSWNSVYEVYIAAGLSPERAKEETDSRVFMVD